MPEKLIHAESGGSFGARLATAMDERGPLCVGIDPHPALLDAWDLPRTSAGLERFALAVVQALGETVAVFKPQSAFFEAFGSAGIAVLERVLVESRQAGALTLLDAKRGDIGSTMAAYAAGYLTDGAPLAADALTVSPYLGFGSLRPAVDAALESGRGLFVLCRTSNPEGAQVQLARGNGTGGDEAAGVRPGGDEAAGVRPGGDEAADSAGSGGASAVTVAQRIADAAADLNAGAAPLGSIGLVVGATIGRTGVDLSAVNGPMLAPGLGAQGATAEDLRTIFADAHGALLPSTSRQVLGAGPSVAKLRDVAARTIDEVRAALG
jgi:orotidine-5'-phosphate decarboxylase